MTGELEWKRSLRRPRHRQKDSNKMGFKKIGCELVNLTLLAQDWMDPGTGFYEFSNES